MQRQSKVLPAAMNLRTLDVREIANRGAVARDDHQDELMAPPRRNHLVPQLWLKAFADSKHRLIARRRNGHEHPVQVKDATVVAHFYRDESDAPSDPQAVERYLAGEVESPVRGTVEEVARGRLPISETSRQDLIKLLAFQIVRTRAFRDIDQQITAHLYPLFFAMEVVTKYEEQATEPPNSATLQRVFDDARRRAPSPDIQGDPRAHLRVFLRTADSVARQLQERALLLASGTRPVLIIGDAPAVLFHPGGRPTAWVGLLPDEADLLVPVAPNRLLIATKRDQVGPVVLTPELATAANTVQASSCFDAVYRRPDTRWPRDLALAPQRPALPAPRVTIERRSGTPTFPARFDAVSDPRLDQLIRDLGGADVVS